MLRKVETFIFENYEFFSQPIIKSFFNDYDNFLLLKRAIENRDKDADIELNNKFVGFYMKYRIIKYISVLAHHYSNYYDKKLKKQSYTYSLLLDTPLSNENNDTFINFIESKEADIFERITEKTKCFEEIIENEQLYYAFLNLSEKQRLVLNLLFLDGLSQKEIAKKLNSTPQNISKIKRKAINLLRKKINYT